VPVKSFKIISENIPEKAIIAIVNISAEDIKAGEYVEELTLLFVISGKYDIVDRRGLEIIRNEPPRPEGTRYVVLIKYLYSGFNTLLNALKLPRRKAGSWVLNPSTRISPLV
jgi:hypothetical protein